MRVLHEEALDKISAIPGYEGATKGELAEHRRETIERLVPLEATVRDHSMEIERQKHGRG